MPDFNIIDVVLTVKRQIFSWLLLLFVLFNIGSATLFVHRHDIAGCTIFHSHPFSGNPESHSHSLAQLEFISRAANPDIVISDVESLSEYSPILELSYNVERPSNIFIILHGSTHLRAPPVA